MGDLFVGVMSGTSLDGADVVLVAFSDASCELIAAQTTPLPKPLTRRLRAIADTPETSLTELGSLDTALGRFFGECVVELLHQSGTSAESVRAVGYSGHTLYHRPTPPDAFTLQIGDPNSIAAVARIDTIGDFRRMDVALGGQGAPLTPTFHSWRFSASDEVRVVLNLGGVANITILEPGKDVTGFDTGPANSLMDAWCRNRWNIPFDDEGRRARGGTVSNQLLDAFLKDRYFATKPPKSTGFEHFNLGWVEAGIRRSGVVTSDRDVLTTLTELTAISVSDAIEAVAPACARTIMCGGGTFNKFLTERLQDRLPRCRMESSEAHGVAPEWVEAIAFAWLARRRLDSLFGNAPSVTGARQKAVLGGLYSAKAAK